jgi:hypothetical protein
MPQGSSDLGGMKAKRPKDATMALRQPKEIELVKTPDRSKNLGTYLHKASNRPEKGTSLQEIQLRANEIEKE